MKLIKNTGNDRVMDALHSGLSASSKLDIATPAFSVFAFAEFAPQLQGLSACRLVLPDASQTDLQLLGTDADRSFRNQLTARWLARQCVGWISNRVEVRNTQTPLPQSSLIATDGALSRAITGHCPFTTDGLGLTPGNPLSLIQCSETPDECATLQTWFTKLWESLPASPEARQNLLAQLATITEHKAPALAYYQILYHLFKDLGDTLDEEQIVKSATGIRNTVVWKKLFKFQRDGVVGAIDKLARLGGCIIADSVGLGKTFEALSPRSKERGEEFAAEGEIDLLIATDCISEGQNLQDCDFLINYDIHWNPVRIIQRFGRIDRIGSPNARIQLVNFWPNMELEEYINLEQRVSGRMVLLDISATGEENIIEQQTNNQMNDLEYRRKQLLKLQDAVIDLEDLSSGVSITDLTLNDFRIDLARFLKDNLARLESLPFGTFAVTTTHGDDESAIPPGVIFCLRAVGAAAMNAAEPGYPLAPHYLVHVGDDGAVLLAFTQAKQVLDRLKKLCVGRDLTDDSACARLDKTTRNGENMSATQQLLAKAVASVVGKKEERAVASLFSPGGTHAMKGEFAGINDFEVVAFLAVLHDQAQ